MALLGQSKTRGILSPMRRKVMLGFSCSVRMRSEIHGGHGPQRARKRQTESRDEEAATCSGMRQHLVQHTDASFALALQPRRPLAQEQLHSPGMGSEAVRSEGRTHRDCCPQTLNEVEHVWKIKTK